MLKRVLIVLGVLLVVLGVLVGTALYRYPKAQILESTRQPAPDFTLADAQGHPFTLSSAKGHKVVLYFYRGYW
jgi:cytochrome oxidase Cu insertion factor (SCO1/SenC/PrrC family)